MKLLALLCTLLLCPIVLADAPATRPAEKPPIIPRAEWGSKPLPIPDSRRHTPRFITVHHAGVNWKAGTDPAQFVRNMQKWGQNEKKWPDLAYHFMIAPDGRIFEARDIAYEPESNTKYDLQGHIGVELMGNFETQRASIEQVRSLTKLLAWLSQDLKITDIAGHKDRARGQTSCPGRDLYRYLHDGPIAKWMAAMQRGEAPDIELLPPLEGGPTTMIGAPAATRPSP